TSVTSGYSGGDMKRPTYEDVSSEITGHAEVVRVEFDPKVISYKQLLDVFWTVHDPTSLNRQGNDIGAQYRSLILYTTPEQKKEAEKSKQEVQKKIFARPIVTEIKPLKSFYKAEGYHQDYYTKNFNLPYCQYVISPKIQHLRETFAHLLKS
ncbi:peptide-methionine (S)-S-oxide reductase MsrA, partial [Candidatus Roizmanbacteria bacterium]|nr:peptide-methionine (S)-S-oxide reductase MsrA [Candidatus Roizmanbacteria bacterium]